jgi:Mitochondrial K+-H+ exchange-related
VKIYMVLIDEKRFFFFADESDLDLDDDGERASSEEPRSGIRKWVVDRVARFKTAWHDAGSGALYWVRRAWDWLHTLARPDEAMLARLRSARQIKLHHPAARNEAVVLGEWQSYLTRQGRRHYFWLGVNALITPFATALFVLPGPNVIGIWFAYRTVHHMIVVWGISRAQRNQIPIELQAVESLDQPVEHGGEGKARHAALEGADEKLGQHVSWRRRSFFGYPRGGRGESQPSAKATPPILNRAAEPETGDHASSEL